MVDLNPNILVRHLQRMTSVEVWIGLWTNLGLLPRDDPGALTLLPKDSEKAPKTKLELFGPSQVLAQGIHFWRHNKSKLYNNHIIIVL